MEIEEVAVSPSRLKIALSIAWFLISHTFVGAAIDFVGLLVPLHPIKTSGISSGNLTFLWVPSILCSASTGFLAVWTPYFVPILSWKFTFCFVYIIHGLIGTVLLIFLTMACDVFPVPMALPLVGCGTWAITIVPLFIIGLRRTKRLNPTEVGTYKVTPHPKLSYHLCTPTRPHTTPTHTTHIPHNTHHTQLHTSAPNHTTRTRRLIC